MSILFRTVAEACDLIVEHHSTYGWSITSPSDALLEFCVENNLTEIRLNRNDVMSIAVGVSGTHAGTFTGTAGRKPSSTRKYICPCCGMSVRATRNVNIACLDRNEPLVIAAQFLLVYKYEDQKSVKQRKSTNKANSANFSAVIIRTFFTLGG